MKLRKTGLFIPLEERSTLLDVLTPTLQEEYNVSIDFVPCLPRNSCEVFLSSTSAGRAYYKDAMVLIKFSIKHLKRIFRRKRRDRKTRKRYVRKLLKQLERKTFDNVDVIDLNSLSDTVVWKSGSQNNNLSNQNAHCDLSHTVSKSTVDVKIEGENSPVTFDKNTSAIKIERGSSPVTFEKNNDEQIVDEIVQESKLVQTEGDVIINIGSNMSPLTRHVLKTGLRPVIVDGSNVAFSHGKHIKFSCDGLLICINYFKDRGHKVKAVLPNYRKAFVFKYILKEWEIDGTLMFTPSRRINDRQIVCDDDRHIIQTAAALDGIIVSLDQFRNFLGIYDKWDRTIIERLLMFTWVNDQIIFPLDPLGPDGPTLDDFLRF